MNKILIYTGEQPKNPYKNRGIEDCNFDIIEQDKHDAWDEGQLSILNQCVEVDLDALKKEYEKTCNHGYYVERSGQGDTALVDRYSMPFSQFIQSEIKKQEGKDHGKD